MLVLLNSDGDGVKNISIHDIKINGLINSSRSCCVSQLNVYRSDNARVCESRFDDTGYTWRMQHGNFLQKNVNPLQGFG